MKIIFCEDPLDARNVDDAYRREAEAVAAQGLTFGLVSYEALVNRGNPVEAVKRVSLERSPAPGLYRGWMLTPSRYTQLYAALAGKGIRLINDPQAYRYCHYLPESYPDIEPHTPKSVWLPVSGSVHIDDIMALLTPFGARPVVVKDFVKSQKHYWYEACYIPSAGDRDAVGRVVNRFLELQGDGLNEGLVFREFVEFEPLAAHSKSGMPLSREFRVFVLDGEPLYGMDYWEEGDYPKSAPPLELFRDVMQKVKSRFYTMDLAKRLDGSWAIVELGDAQVSGLPDTADVHKFYELLNGKLAAQAPQDGA